MENLSPKLRTQLYKAEPEHRLFISGYIASFNMDGDVWEFYEPLKIWKLSLEKEEEKKTEPERKQRPFYGNTEYEEEQLLDEDNYEDW